MRRLTAPIALCLILTFGCETPPTAAPAGAGAAITAAMSDAGGRAMVRTELLFGMSKDDGTGIDEAEWDKFVEDSISVWFPSGFTVVDSHGRWRSRDGKIVNERSKLLIIFHDGSEENLRKLDDLRRLYTQRFGQQAVMRGSTNAWVAF
jgi:hypothetical protein